MPMAWLSWEALDRLKAAHPPQHTESLGLSYLCSQQQQLHLDAGLIYPVCISCRNPCYINLHINLTKHDHHVAHWLTWAVLSLLMETAIALNVGLIYPVCISCHSRCCINLPIQPGAGTLAQ